MTGEAGADNCGPKGGAILIVASSFATSNVLGGHYRSAAAIASLLCSDYNVTLLNPGAQPSPVMKIEGVETVFCEGRPERPSPLRAKIARLMQERRVRVVLAFDQKAGELLRPLARQLGVGFVLVKPGGGQPRLYYPRAEHNIVFMSADAHWLAARNPNHCRTEMAAGRITLPAQDMAAQEALRAEVGLSEKDMAIVRIGRLHPHYAAVNRAALALAARLRDQGLPARLIMIGTPQSEEEHAELNSLKGPEDAILCNQRFTDQASRLLGLFHFNVGTGRGFMEGAAMGHVMFCASQNPEHDLPMLVTEENFQGFFADNFSGRITPDVAPEANAARIFAMAQNSAQQAAQQASARDWFTRYFSAETSRPVYVGMIEAAAAAPERWTSDYLKSELHLRFSVLLDRLRKRWVG